MILLFTILVFSSVSAKQSLQSKIWDQRCKYKSWTLNDCNWCQCDASLKYQCTARPCSTVDMFGHFKDAIGDITVGMEGHGAWRTTRTPCSPGMNYRRNGLLCVCNEDGEWPNPVCRDIFRILYSVEPTGVDKVNGNESCIANKLYLVGCNVCFCSPNGYLNANLCTNMTCQQNDPVLQIDEHKEDEGVDEEIYATCDIKKEYLLGCRKCICLRNNRLMCKNCSDTIDNLLQKSYCDRNSGKIFNIDCNSCHCDAKKNMFCTAKNCLEMNSKKIKEISVMKRKIRDESNDICDSKEYEKGCHSCDCIKSEHGDTVLDCSTQCNKTKQTIHEDCVENTIYEKNCQICHCYLKSNKKRELCMSNPICYTNMAPKEEKPKGLQNMHGYCEPLHIYNKDCNVCKCLSDGKTLKCTSNICSSSKSVTVDMIPVQMDAHEDCPKGHSYKIDCNVCFCLSNGNSICTTVACSK